MRENQHEEFFFFFLTKLDFSLIRNWKNISTPLILDYLKEWGLITKHKRDLRGSCKSSASMTNIFCFPFDRNKSTRKIITIKRRNISNTTCNIPIHTACIPICTSKQILAPLDNFVRNNQILRWDRVKEWKGYYYYFFLEKYFLKISIT